MVERKYFQKPMIVDKISSKKDLEELWNSIDWPAVRECVFRQQCRIARAAEEGRLSDVLRLQEELTGSDEAKALAVKEVTQRKSRDMPGVDGVLWKTSAEKMYVAFHLNEEGYTALPLRRFYLPKESGTMRPIGIAAMNDRAMQMLYSYALQPVAETLGDPHSFGYRLFRSAKDACTAIRNFLGRQAGDVWVLDADITGCFDNISHNWLLKHIPLRREYLRQVLKSGYIYCGRYFRISRGVPQGGIISPILANMTLDGLEPALMETFGRSCSTFGLTETQKPRLLFVRYADDFIVLSSSRSVVEDAWDETNAFLKPRGLCLSEEKTPGRFDPGRVRFPALAVPK